MKVLVLSQYYWPETFCINEVVDSLQGQGCHITVLTGQPNYPQGKVFGGYHIGGFGLQQHKLGYDIYRVPLVPRGSGGAIGLALNYISFVLSACVLGPWLLRKQHFDVIFVYAPSPIIQAVPGVWLA
ncbi:MAG: glycosyltransferase WbuB, partial [Glaciimonas sp.]|nr:glycosyltransferase WbuB [Glaciimonas sp.]